MKCSRENVILRGIVHVLSGFPLHFMFYRGNLDWFSRRAETQTFKALNMNLVFEYYQISFCKFLNDFCVCQLFQILSLGPMLFTSKCCGLLNGLILWMLLKSIFQTPLRGLYSNCIFYLVLILLSTPRSWIRPKTKQLQCQTILAQQFVSLPCAILYNKFVVLFRSL